MNQIEFTLYKRAGRKYWYYRYYVDGIRHEKSTGVEAFECNENVAYDYVMKELNGVGDEMQDLTLGALFDIFANPETNPRLLDVTVNLPTEGYIKKNIQTLRYARSLIAQSKNFFFISNCKYYGY